MRQRTDGSVAGGAGRFIVTGGPGFGKSTLVEALASAGWKAYREAARICIDEWISRGAQSPSPWEERSIFYDKIVEIMLTQYRSHEAGVPAIFDRGLPDAIAWRRHYGLNVPRRLLELISKHPYESVILLAPPWREIYVRDLYRPMSFEEAEGIHKSIVETYLRLGYQVIELPRVDIPGRVRLVAEILETNQRRTAK